MTEYEELRKLAALADERGDKETALAALQKMETLGKQGGSPVVEGANILAAQSVPVRAISNIPGSAMNLATGLAQAVMSPIETAKAIGGTVVGFGQKLIPGEQEQEKYADAMMGYYGPRLRSPVETFAKDPIGTMADVSMFAGLGSMMAKVAGAKATAKALGDVSRGVDPIAAAVSGAKGVAKPVYEFAIGQTTSSGRAATSASISGGKGFSDAMRGKITEAEVLDDIKGAFGKVVKERGTKYRSRLAQLKSNQQSINIDDVKQAADGWLDEMGVKKGPEGLDFSKSKVTGKGVEEVSGVYNDLMKWGSDPADLTPLGLDTLKQRMQRMYNADSNTRAMVADLKSKVQQKIETAVPQYAEMTRDYSKASDVIDEMQRSLGVGDRTAADTALRKLMTSMREDKTFRRAIMEDLQKATGADVTDKVGGLLMKEAYSNRLGAIMTSGVAGGAAVGVSPYLIAIAGLASPRLMGEFGRLLNTFGKAGKYARMPALLGYESQAPYLPGQEQQ